MPVTELIAEPQRLRDFYDPNDFSEVEAHQEMHRVMQETAIERTWLGEAGMIGVRLNRSLAPVNNHLYAIKLIVQISATVSL